jgi:hypothetical protein
MPGFADSPRPANYTMKSFFILTLALGLLAGCGAKNDKTSMETNPSLKSDADATLLAENAKKEGVKTTASGLQYQVIQSVLVFCAASFGANAGFAWTNAPRTANAGRAHASG